MRKSKPRQVFAVLTLTGMLLCIATPALASPSLIIYKNENYATALTDSTVNHATLPTAIYSSLVSATKDSIVSGYPFRIKSVPYRLTGTVGGLGIVTLTAEDTYGNPLPNCTIYLLPNIPGLWITQVNGNTITSDVNMGTASSPSIQTVNTPVPLFSVANAPAYDSVSTTGLSADHLQTIPTVALTTGDNGTISITLQDGNLLYVANTVSPTVANSYTVDPGKGIWGKALTFYSDLAGTQKITTTMLYWSGR